MTTLSAKTFKLTGDNLIDALTQGSRWVTPPNGKIQWSISGGWNGEKAPGAIKAQIGAALDAYSAFANLNFVYKGKFANPTKARKAGAELNFMIERGGERFDPEPNIFGQSLLGLAGFPNDPAKEAGDVSLNYRLDFKPAKFNPGTEGGFLLIHEIGHTLGLKHPHDDGGSGRPTFQALKVGKLDADIFSMMSYNDKSKSNFALAQQDLDPVTPMFLDVLALQFLYGPNTSANAGDTSHVLKAKAAYQTIWDASGKDTVDVSKSNEGWMIALPSDRLTNQVDTRFGLALPSAQDRKATPETLYWLTGDLENLKGSRFADTLHGSVLDNKIEGLAGKDDILGDKGRDKLFGGRGDDEINGNKGADRLRGDAGNDMLDGGKDNDVLAGGSGHDQFHFVGAFGKDKITDFDTGSASEVIDLSKVKPISGWKDLRDNHLTQNGDDAVITAGANKITLLDVESSDLAKEDFLF